MGGKERIQKVLAAAGAGSRRHVEDWIRAGRVTVNGRVARIGEKVGLQDRIQVDGKGVALPRGTEPVRVLAYKKRAGEVVTRADPEGRRTVFRKLPKLERGRWIAIGRLDLNTSGLLLFTNSGELARRLMHPRFGVEREYAVRVLGAVDDGLIRRLRAGVRLEEGTARFEQIWRADRDPEDGADGAANRWFHVVVREGRHRVVRRLWESQRCQVSRLIRVRFGPVALGRGTRSSGYRELAPAEVRALQHGVGLDTD